jgi:hypothetical protein
MKRLQVGDLSDRRPLAIPLRCKAQPLFQFVMSPVFSFDRVCILILTSNKELSSTTNPGSHVER